MGAVTECQGRWLLKASVSPEGTLAKRGGHWAFLWGMHAALAWAALRSGLPTSPGLPADGSSHLSVPLGVTCSARIDHVLVRWCL